MLNHLNCSLIQSGRKVLTDTDILPSLRERQCRELWKLRATLHDDSCVADDWNSYHQPLNRRYDSGYKSIENQFSSSIEGANQSIRRESPVEAQAPIGNNQASSSIRPKSECSGALDNSDRSTHPSRRAGSVDGTSWPPRPLTASPTNTTVPNPD